MSKFLHVCLFSFLIISGCLCGKEEAPYVCADCTHDRICIDNKCECPPGTIATPEACIPQSAQCFETSLKGTPLECFGDAILDFEPPHDSVHHGKFKFNIYYSNGNWTSVSGGNRYIKLNGYDSLYDMMMDVSTLPPCDAASGRTSLGVFNAIWDHSKDEVLTSYQRYGGQGPVDTINLTFKRRH